jgi:hypothetical protein
MNNYWILFEELGGRVLLALDAENDTYGNQVLYLKRRYSTIRARGFQATR